MPTRILRTNGNSDAAAGYKISDISRWGMLIRVSSYIIMLAPIFLYPKQVKLKFLGDASVRLHFSCFLHLNFTRPYNAYSLLLGVRSTPDPGLEATQGTQFQTQVVNLLINTTETQSKRQLAHGTRGLTRPTTSSTQAELINYPANALINWPGWMRMMEPHSDHPHSRGYTEYSTLLHWTWVTGKNRFVSGHFLQIYICPSLWRSANGWSGFHWFEDKGNRSTKAGGVRVPLLITDCFM